MPTYALIDQLVRQKAEDYDDSELSSIYIRIYLSEMKSSVTPNISDDDIAIKLWECIDSKVEPREASTPKEVRVRISFLLLERQETRNERLNSRSSDR